jgi:predicted ATPase/DNA-binding CsgD family transcriptional regulator
MSQVVLKPQSDAAAKAAASSPDFRLWDPARDGEEPGARGRPGTPHNLVLQPTRLLGRDTERDAASHQLLSADVRLLTLTGPAGVGKTRLALEVAAALLTRFTDGVWFVDLAPVRDPGLVSVTIGQAIGAAQPGVSVSLPDLQGYLAERQALLVLDNFEQVLPAATELADLLATCPGVKLLVTSRSRLRLRWEHVVPLQPLTCVGPHAQPSVAAAAALPGVALFVERAQSSCPEFALTPDNVCAVASLCCHLDGLPLAIELAAARANLLSPDEMLGWSEHRLPVLRWEAQDVPVRQHSLRGALEWSYALLSSAEQALFRRLAVFAGSWTLQAAAAVTQVESVGLHPAIGLAALVDASLVQITRPEGESRFTMLETLREFAYEHLDASGELEETQRRNADFGAALAPAPPVDPEPTEAVRKGHPAGLLSPREQEVLQLVSDGLTNKQIAEQLIIAVATVNYHVTSLLNKLGAENRTRAVSLATQQGLL